MEVDKKKSENELDYDPFDSIDLIKMEDEVKLEPEVRFNLFYPECKLQSISLICKLQI